MSADCEVIVSADCGVIVSADYEVIVSADRGVIVSDCGVKPNNVKFQTNHVNQRVVCHQIPFILIFGNFITTNRFFVGGRVHFGPHKSGPEPLYWNKN